MNNTSIGENEFCAMLARGEANLSLHRTEVNDLNVFPIPDGDTGDNMLMTFSSGVKAATSACGDLSCAARALSSGMLLGARGNSGVILSRIFAGITKALEGKERADVTDLKRGMREGVKQAYSAVSKPVEGTILTVFKDAVNYAESRDNDTIAAYFTDLAEEMSRSLEKTTELLPVLADAGVVDSGGAGLVYIFSGISAYVSGEGEEADGQIAATAVFGKTGDSGAVSATADFSLFTADSVLEFGYCTEFLLRLQNSKTDVEAFDVKELADYLEKTGGESVVAFKDDSIVKVHVHTKTPGAVLNYCQNFGEFLTLKIENMTFQNEEAVKRGGNAQAALKNKPKKKNAFVVVASGKGIKDTFLSMGADVVIEGGQSMNPSAKDFIDAFEKAAARRIFVFPNNSNVIMTAKQAAELYDGEVVVIESKTVGECYAALSMMDISEDSDSALCEAEEIMSGIVTAYVSNASRDAEMNGVSVRRGDYIGFVKDDVYCDFESRDIAARTLVSRLDVDEYGVMLIFAGEDADYAEAEKLRDDIAASHKNLEVILIDGGQPIYDYMIVLE